MKPKQPNPSNYFQNVSIYGTTGVRTDTGGFTQSQTLLRSIWCSVKNYSKPSEGETEGRRTFVRAIKVMTRKGLVELTNLIQYQGEMYFVYNINDSNPAEDVIYAEKVE